MNKIVGTLTPSQKEKRDEREARLYAQGKALEIDPIAEEIERRKQRGELTETHEEIFPPEAYE